MADVRRLAVVWVLAMATGCGATPSQTAPTAATTITPALATTAATASTPTLAASPTARAAVAVIEMGDHFFDPAQLTVKVGSTVTWKSVGQSTHDLAARDGSFALGAMSFGQTFSFTFAKAGRYPYVCMQHEGDGMIGEVTVVD
ncbi:MAG: plastocyanin/azurin family copper-binding protein [Chloroflexota bacterium]